MNRPWKLPLHLDIISVNKERYTKEGEGVMLNLPVTLRLIISANGATLPKLAQYGDK